MSGAERRRHPRARLDAPVRLKVGERLVEASVRDICRDAVLVEANHWFPLGTELQVRIDFDTAARTLPATGFPIGRS